MKCERLEYFWLRGRKVKGSAGAGDYIRATTLAGGVSWLTLCEEGTCSSIPRCEPMVEIAYIDMHISFREDWKHYRAVTIFRSV